MYDRASFGHVNSTPRKCLFGPGYPFYRRPQVINTPKNSGLRSAVVGCTSGSSSAGGSSSGQQIHPNYFANAEFNSRGNSFHAESLPLPPKREIYLTTVSSNAKKTGKIKDSPKKEAQAKVSSSSPKNRRTKAKDNESLSTTSFSAYFTERETNV